MIRYTDGLKDHRPTGAIDWLIELSGLSKKVRSEINWVRDALLQPGQSIETDTDIEDSATASSANPFVQIEVRLDYLLFADGSKAGKDTLKIGERISYGRQTADRLRDQLLEVYQGA
jgi:hypothetical protein